MVVAISAERHRAICHPLSLRQARNQTLQLGLLNFGNPKSRLKPIKYIAFVIFLSFTLELPRWFEFSLRFVALDLQFVH